MSLKTKPVRRTPADRPEPEGVRMMAVLARGIRRWRERLGLSVAQAAERFKVDKRQWYFLENGQQARTMNKYIDHLCVAMKISLIDLIKLGSE